MLPLLSMLPVWSEASAMDLSVDMPSPMPLLSMESMHPWFMLPV